MLKDITLGQFFPGESFIHKLDPRTKIIIAMVYIVMLFMITDFIGYFFIFLYSVMVIKISKIPVKYIIKGLKPIVILLVITSLLNLFITKGEHPVFPNTFITVTWEGVNVAVMMILRLVFLVVGTSMLTYTTSPIVLTDGIESFLKPLKKIGVPAHEISMMMTIALRFIPTLFEETDKIMKAQQARGADFESGNILKRAKSLIPLLVPLFVSAFRRADDLAVAMECRCYHGGNNRTRLRVLKYSKRDVFAFMSAGILLIILILVRYYA